MPAAPDTSAPPPRRERAVVACMRNEGLILLEWAAYHLSIGFDRLFIVTNDCDDGTDAMADRLARIAPVTHIRNTPAPGEAPQVAGLARALAHPDMARVEWLLHCDADEFLNITAGEGRVDDLLSLTGDADAIAICWRLMGSGGLRDWQRGSVLETQIHAARKPRPDIALHKTLFRPDRFRRAIDHMPKDPVGEVVLKNTAGATMNPRSLHHATHGRLRRIEPEHVTWDNAALNHYAIRAEDIFLLKNVRGDGMALASTKYFVNSTFWRRSDRNEVEDRSIQRHLPAVRDRLALWHGDADLARLDDLAFAWFDTLRRTHLTAERRAEWTIRREEEDTTDDA